MPRPLRTALLLLALASVGVQPAVAADDPKKEERAPGGMKGRVFEVKYRSPDDLVAVLRPLGSGTKGALVESSNEFRTITVRDFPENLGQIEEALKRLDVPRPAKPDVELRVRVLLASPDGQSHYPKELEPLVRQLRATLAFKSYSQVTELVHRVRDGSGSSSKGPFHLTPPVVSEPSVMSYSLGFEQVSIVPPVGGAAGDIRIRKLAFWVGHQKLGSAEITTAVTMREGVTYMVGTQSLKDQRALILALSAKIVK